MANAIVDVLIIGGGPGGLAVATGLARQLYTCVVFDNKVYRNARTEHMHNFAGWDHQSPATFREKARSDLAARYETAKIEFVGVQSVRKDEKSGYFEAVDANNKTWTGRKLVLANGTKLVAPPIAGYEECWGYGIFACLFCHGYEERGLPISGVLATAHSGNAPVALHLSRMARRLTEKVVIYTQGSKELAEALEEELKKDKAGVEGKVTVEKRSITALARGKEYPSQIIATLEDGEKQTLGFLAHQPQSAIAGPFAEQLGLDVTEAGDILVKQPFNEASVPGVFAVGDCASPMKAVSMAVSAGALCAGGLSFQLGAEYAKI